MDRDALLRAGAAGLAGDPAEFVVAADHFLQRGELELAASALDRAFGLAPDDLAIAGQRADLLERFTIREHGLVFRYVPAGTFVMGSTQGDPDERPVHAVALDAYWIGDRPITWAEFCDLMGWDPAPGGHPREHLDDTHEVDESGDRMHRFHLHEANKIRRSYCCGVEAKPGVRAWWDDEEGEEPEPLDEPEGDEADPTARGSSRPPEYDAKPMVAVGWADAEDLAARLSTPQIRYALPNEAQWEKAARGGRIGARFSWGDEPPTLDRCDFGHFGRFLLAPPRSLPANGYGLHGTCGGVWEWTSTLYDALAYANKAAGRVTEAELEGRPDEALIALNQRRANVDPEVAARLLEAPHLRVLRGGSWSDGAAAVTVSTRMAREGWGWKSGHWSDSDTPNVGFRLIRVRAG